MIKRGYTDMTADLFHYGHVNFLRQTKEKCDYLIVGVHSDEAVASYKRIPVMNMEERMAVVESCKYVDEVIADAPVHLTKEYIKNNNIDAVFTVDNRSDSEMKIMYDVPLEMGILNFVKYTDTISTTDIIKRLKNREDL